LGHNRPNRPPQLLEAQLRAHLHVSQREISGANFSTVDAHHSVFKTPFYEIGMILAESSGAGSNFQLSQWYGI
jgi:hypothetical protein